MAHARLPPLAEHRSRVWAAVNLRMTSFELLHAAHAGVARNVSAIRDGRPLEEGRRDLGFERHIVGAIGEYAVARALGVCWRPAVGRLDTETGDIAGLQIKSTTNPAGELIVRPHDPGGFNYVLVVVRVPDVRIVGWFEGHAAKQPGYWREKDGKRVHRAAFFVEQPELHAWETLAAVFV